MATPRTIKQMGPGSLVVAAPGGGSTTLDLSAQVTKLVVSAKGDSEDATPVLSGGTVAGARMYEWTLGFDTYQDAAKDGVVDWSWRNAGAETTFTYTDNSSGEVITGRVTVDPIDYGGDVKKKNISEVEWGIVGTPTFTPGTAAGAGTTPAV